MKCTHYTVVNDFTHTLDTMQSDGTVLLDYVRTMVDDVGTADLCDDERYFSLLYWVCLRRHEMAVRFLIERRAQLCGGPNGRPMGPLLGAVSGGNIEIVRMLIEAGANLDDRDSQGDTALLRAINHDKLDIFELLLESGADPTLKNVADVCPLNTKVNAATELRAKEILSRNGYSAGFAGILQTPDDFVRQWREKKRQEGNAG